MAVIHPDLHRVLMHHFAGNPNLSKGISVRDGQLVYLHPSLGKKPTEATLRQWIADYEALPADHESKDPEAARKKRFDALGNGLADLKNFIRTELL